MMASALFNLRNLPRSLFGTMLGRQVKPFDEQKFNQYLMEERGVLHNRIKQMLIDNYQSSGLKSKTGTMERAVNNIHVDVSVGHVYWYLPQDIEYPRENGKKANGDFYAAAGSFRYGAVRQPRPMREVLDPVIGAYWPGKKNVYRNNHRVLRVAKKGVFGTNAKRTLKRYALDGHTLTASEKRSNSGKAVKAYETKGGGVSVIKPRYPFMELTPSQKEELSKLNRECVLKALERVK